MAWRTVDELRERIASDTRAPVFVVGSGLAIPSVPGVQKMVELIKAELDPTMRARLEELLEEGGNQYQIAFNHLLGVRPADAANRVIRSAVLSARYDHAENPLVPRARAGELDACDALSRASEDAWWQVPPGLEALGRIVHHFSASKCRIVTTNFDPLIEVAVRRAGARPVPIAIVADENALSADDLDGVPILHLHGHWYRGDALHTAEALSADRPRLRASLRRVMEGRLTIVLGYGGWDDIVMRTILELSHDPGSFEIRWAFREWDKAAVQSGYASLLRALEAAPPQRLSLHVGVDANAFLPALAETLGAVSMPPLAARFACRLHRRTCHVKKDGIAQVIVMVDDIFGAGRMPLAVVSPPYRGFDFETAAVVDGRHTEVAVRTLRDGSRAYSAMLEQRSCKHLEWRCFVSGGFAITAEELNFLPKRDQLYPNLTAVEDAYAHVVEFPCARLELELLFDSLPSLVVTRVVVEQPLFSDGEWQWVVDEDETKRSQARCSTDGLRMSLLLDAPVVGRRYSLAYQPGSTGADWPADATALATEIIRECRAKNFERSRLQKYLTTAVGAGLSEALGGILKEWVGLIWDNGKRSLRPSFGEFSVDQWAEEVEAGSGIAGHAFRHSGIVAWTWRAPTVASSAVTNTVDRDSPGTKRWSLLIPIHFGPTEPAIGVVAIEGGEPTTDAERKCQKLARHVTSTGRASRELASLVVTLSIAFWVALSEFEDLSAFGKTQLEKWTKRKTRRSRARVTSAKRR